MYEDFVPLMSCSALPRKFSHSSPEGFSLGIVSKIDAKYGEATENFLCGQGEELIMLVLIMMSRDSIKWMNICSLEFRRGLSVFYMSDQMCRGFNIWILNF